MFMRVKDKSKLKQVALEKVHELFKEAKSNQEKADKLVETARKIAMKVNLPIPKEYKRRYCKHCNNSFKSGNYRVRTRNKMIVYYCLNCKKYMKIKI